MKAQQPLLDILGAVFGALLGMWGINFLMSPAPPSTGTWLILGAAVLTFCSLMASMVCAESLIREKRNAKVSGIDSSSQASGIAGRAGIGMKASGLMVIFIGIVVLLIAAELWLVFTP